MGQVVTSTNQRCFIWGSPRMLLTRCAPIMGGLLYIARAISCTTKAMPHRHRTGAGSVRGVPSPHSCSSSALLQMGQIAQ